MLYPPEQCHVLFSPMENQHSSVSCSIRCHAPSLFSMAGSGTGSWES